jgi:DnaJ domain
MSEANFYQILGVGRSASANQIRSAYRDLVKRHHPDLFSTPGEKAQATDKLRQINEAYAVLGNSKRRHDYDQSFVQKPRPRPRVRPSRRGPGAARPQPKPAARRRARKIPIEWRSFSRKRAGYALIAVTAVILLIYAVRSVPRLTTAWTLVEKVEISSAASAVSSPMSTPPASAQERGKGWSAVAQFTSVSECAEALKRSVRDDERAGGKAVFDERNGMMAITVQVKKDPARPENSASPNAESERAAAGDAAPGEGSSQERARASESTVSRVRNLECRATQRMETEPWFQQTLRGWGLLQ